MTKMLIYIDEEDHAQLRRLSFEKRRPMAALVREAVHDWLKRNRKGDGRHE
jgi:hypothetical protein